jgi:cytochrome c
VASGLHGVAQGPTYKLGQPATKQQLAMPDLAVGPDGKDLPRGSGTAREGATVYVARGCARCHGSNGAGGPGPVLVGPPGGNRGIVSYAFAPLLWSYINQMMPLDMQQQFTALKKFAAVEWSDSQAAPCCLNPDEVYGLTAFLLFRGGIIAEDQVMNADTLPQVKMPNRDSYAPPPYLKSPWKPGMRQAENK